MPTHQHTTPWLLVVVFALTLLGTVAISAFLAAPSGVMLGVAILAVLGGCGLVLAAISHELDQDED